MIRNLHTDPRCLKQRVTWSSDGGLTATQGEDGLYTYSYTGAYTANVYVPVNQSASSLIPVGDVLYARLLDFDESTVERGVECCRTVASGPDWVAASVSSVGNHTLYLNPGTSLTLVECGWYTAVEWELVYGMYEAGSLPTPWFHGLTMPMGGA